MRPQTLADVGIEVPFSRSGEVDTTCPQCSTTREKRTARCLSVNTDLGTWLCHHCGWTGGLGMNGTGDGAPLRQRVSMPTPPRVYSVPKQPPPAPLPPRVVEWFAGRGIPKHILHAAGITAGQEWCPQVAGYVVALRFPYLRDGRLINIKYRALTEKAFWMVKGAERILYRLDDIAGQETIVIVEGEIDALSIRAADGPPVVSVPDGAPPPDAKHYASKFAFLDATAMESLRVARTVLIATDMDAPGQKLADELARRIGYATCKRVSWHPYKDANEMLVAQGPAAVLNALVAALPVPALVDESVPQGMRPIRVLPPVRGRRPVVELPPVETCHAR